MIRFAILTLCAAACGHSQGASDQELPGLVTEVRKPEPAIDVARAARDPGELGRALGRPYRLTLAALGPHSVSVNTETTVEEAGKPVSELSDHAQIDNGESGAYHAVYANSADYGRETTFVDGKLYVRPRYQRWHARDLEAPDEAVTLRDQYADAPSAVWDLLAPGAELADGGATTIGGRTGHKISVSRSSEPSKPPGEPLAQRAWREGRSVEAVTGEIVLDSEKGVPLAVKLAGTVGFSRDGRRFTMKIALDSAVSGVGSPAEIAAPSDDEVVATPERRREVDDRDYLLQGIAPPLRRNPDGTAVPPAPLPAPTSTAAPAPAPTPNPSKTRPDDPAKRSARPKAGATP